MSAESAASLCRWGSDNGSLSWKACQFARSLKSFRITDGEVAGVPCTIARTGYTGEDGVELFCAWNSAPTLFRALLAAGKAFGIEPVEHAIRDGHLWSLGDVRSCQIFLQAQV